jgi:hypothetical protein
VRSKWCNTFTSFADQSVSSAATLLDLVGRNGVIFKQRGHGRGQRRGGRMELAGWSSVG